MGHNPFRRIIMSTFQDLKRSVLASTVLLLAAAALQAAPVDINSADAATLSRELKGIGDAKAAAIVEYRQKHGAFRNIDELTQVKGVGQKLIDRNRADLRLGRVAAGVTPLAGMTVVVPAVRPVAKPAGKPGAAPLPVRK
jgi:competence protein ComEA